jgi:early secretory antigenic target protein ESAT-6
VDGVEVSFEHLQTGSAAIDTHYKSLLTTLDDLEGQLRPMVNSWTGNAQSAYQMTKKQWDDAAQALGTILHGIGQAVQQAHDNYHSTESRNTGIWHGGGA